MLNTQFVGIGPLMSPDEGSLPCFMFIAICSQIFGGGVVVVVLKKMQRYATKKTFAVLALQSCQIDRSLVLLSVVARPWNVCLPAPTHTHTLETNSPVLFVLVKLQNWNVLLEY